MYSWAARYDSVTHVQLCSELNANCPCEIFSTLHSGYFLKSDLLDTFQHELTLQQKSDHVNFCCEMMHQFKKLVRKKTEFWK